MKRDFDLMRAILLSYAGYGDWASDAEIAYNRQLLIQAGLLLAAIDTSLILTFQGWEIADSIADDEIWSWAKEQVAKSGLETVSFEMLLDIVRGKVKEKYTQGLWQQAMKNSPILERLRVKISPDLDMGEWFLKEGCNL